MYLTIYPYIYSSIYLSARIRLSNMISFQLKSSQFFHLLKLPQTRRYVDQISLKGVFTILNMKERLNTRGSFRPLYVILPLFRKAKADQFVQIRRVHKDDHSTKVITVHTNCLTDFKSVR